MKNIYTFILLMVLMCFCSPAHAETDFSISRSRIVTNRNELEDILHGKSRYSDVKIKDICRFILTDYVMTELGKKEFNHLFHELNNPDQITDIETLFEKVSKTENCKERSRLWLEYDDKWYAPKRNSVIAAQKEAETKLLENLHDTGKDVWDGIINGQLLAVPRKYMWFGSNREDGVSDGINLLLPFKTKQGVEISVAAVLEAGFIEKKPCIGFKEPICTRESMQTPFTASYLACTSPGISGKETYKAMWRRECSFREELNTRQETLQPVFDKELSMWRIGQAGYYEGTPEFPDYFLICGKPDTSWHSHSKNPRCTSGAQIGESLNIYYTFPQRDGFWDHREINKMVVDTVTGFLVK